MRKSTIYSVALWTLAVLMTACSDSLDTVEGKLKTYVPDDADIVFAVNLERSLAVTGSEVGKDGALHPGQPLEDMLGMLSPAQRDDVETFFDSGRLKWTNVVGAFRIVGMKADGIIVFDVSDDDEFVKNVVDAANAELHTIDGVKCIVGNGGGCMAVTDGHGYIALRHSEMCKPEVLLREIEKWKDDADKSPLAEWKTGHLTAGHIFTAYADMGAFKSLVPEMRQTRDEIKRAMAGVFEKTTRGILLFDADIEGQKLAAGLRLVDGEGKAMSLGLTDKKTDTSLLKYCSSDEYVVTALSDIRLILDMSEMKAASQGLLDHCAGTMLVSAGPKTDRINEAFQDRRVGAWNFTVVLPFTDEASAAQVLDRLAKISGGVQAYEPGRLIRMKVSDGYVTDESLEYWDDNYYVPVYTDIYYYRDARYVIISSRDKAQGSCPVTASQLGGVCAVALNLPADGAVMKALNQRFGIAASLKADNTGVTAESKVSGTDESYLDALCNLIGSTLGH